LSGLTLGNATRVIVVTVGRQAVRLVLLTGATIVAYLLIGLFDRPAHASAVAVPPNLLSSVASSPRPPLRASPVKPPVSVPVAAGTAAPALTTRAGTAAPALTTRAGTAARAATAGRAVVAVGVPALSSASAAVDGGAQAASGAVPYPIRAVARPGLLSDTPILASALGVPRRLAADPPLLGLLAPGLRAPGAPLPRLVAASGRDRPPVPARCAAGTTRAPTAVRSSGVTAARPRSPAVPAPGPDRAPYDAAPAQALSCAGDHGPVSAAIAATWQPERAFGGAARPLNPRGSGRPVHHGRLPG
jgi:hypothetical protein